MLWRFMPHDLFSVRNFLDTKLYTLEDTMEFINNPLNDCNFGKNCLSNI